MAWHLLGVTCLCMRRHGHAIGSRAGDRADAFAVAGREELAAAAARGVVAQNRVGDPRPARSRMQNPATTSGSLRRCSRCAAACANRMSTARRVAAAMRSVRGVALVAWTQPPEPTGSRRATPLVAFQQRPSHRPDLPLGAISAFQQDPVFLGAISMRRRNVRDLVAINLLIFITQLYWGE